jgi:drug/metabolite transporter (DMT)-like permease
MTDSSSAAGLTADARSAPPRVETFSPIDWMFLSGTALMWGSSFLFIDVALESFPPFLITLLRLVFGAATLVWFRRARRRIDARDWVTVTLLAIFWMAGPFLLFPLAQQWIASSLAGMINGAVPVFATLIAALIARTRPSARQSVGVIVGFAGVVTVSWPAVQGARSTAVGVVLVLIATISYGIAINIAGPLQHRYGALPVLLRTQFVAILLTAIPGLGSLAGSSFSWTSLAAMVPLGCLGTGVAFVTMWTLVGRVGAARASLAVYFIPVVAIALGAAVRDETIAPISLLGTAMVILGAVLASRESIPNRAAAAK